MNLFNRIVIVLLCLALITGAVSAIALAWTIDADTIAWARDAVDWVDENNADFEKAIFSAVAASIGFLALLVLLIELTPKSSGEVRVSDLQAGNAVLSTSAIGQRIEEAVRGVPHVSEVRTYVKAKRKGVAVALDLSVDSEADLAEVTEQVSQTVREVLANRIHIALAEPPRVRLNYRELRMNRSQQRPAVSAPVAAPATSTIPADLRSEAVVNDGKEVPVLVGSSSGSNTRPDSPVTSASGSSTRPDALADDGSANTMPAGEKREDERKSE